MLAQDFLRHHWALLLRDGLVGLLRNAAGREDSRAVHVGDELRHVVARRIIEDLLGSADLFDTTVAHHRDAIAQTHGLVEIVRDEENRLVELLLQFDELVLHVSADERIECGEGFVHQHDVGPCSERTREADSLPHAAGELAREVVSPPSQTNEFEGLVCLRFSFRLVDAVDLERICGVLPHRPVWQQREVLEDHRNLLAADLAQVRLVHPSNVLALNQHLTRRRGKQAVHGTNESGLAGARQPHDDENLTGLHVERGIDDGRGGSLLTQDITRDALLELLDGSFGTTAKDLVDV